MTDYRFVLGLLVQEYAYRQIEAMVGCSHRAIARARRVLDEEGFTTREQVDGLSLEDIDRLFADGRKSVVEEFVPVDIVSNAELVQLDGPNMRRHTHAETAS
jgi:hypothetical protein